MAPTTRLIVTVRGGCVENIYASNITVIKAIDVLDYDVREPDKTGSTFVFEQQYDRDIETLLPSLQAIY